MAEKNPSEIRSEPSSCSDGIEDHKVSPMRNQGEDENENKRSQVQQKTLNASTAETPPSNAIPRDECPSWCIDIMKADPERPPSKMPKVPENLRNSINEKSYRPLLVSIGPYHHPWKQSGTEDGRPKDGEKLKAENDNLKALEDGEKLKAEMARQFVEEIKKNDKEKSISDEEIWKKIIKEAEKAKGWYDEKLVERVGDEKFTRMMSIDGCFIVHFIYNVTRDDSKFDMSSHKVDLVERDLLLLENQLPYEFLESLRKIRFEEAETDMFDKFLGIDETEESSSIWVRLGYYFLIFIIIISCCCCCCCCCFFCSRGQPLPPSPPEKKKESDIKKEQKKKKKDPTRDEKQPAHLLELLYNSIEPKETGEPKKNGEPKKTGEPKDTGEAKKTREPKDTGEPKKTGDQKTKGKERHRGHYLYYSAKELKKVGIHFQRSGTRGLTNVKFGCVIFPGTLELPPITIKKSTKPMLLNLAAYESTAEKKHWVASYICFMDSLINDAEDVKELRSKGIINNYLGPDEKVAKIFNDMSISLDPEPSVYNEVKRKINDKYESFLTKWVGQWLQDYFSSPWAFFALVGAVFTIFLTAVATYAAIWPIK